MHRSEAKGWVQLRFSPSVRHEKPRPAPGDLEILRAFLNSVEHGDGNPEELGNAEDFASWLEGWKLLPEGVSLTDEDLDRAVRLRSALRSLVSSQGKPGQEQIRTLRQLGECTSYRLVFEDGLDSRYEPTGDAVERALGRLVQLFVDARRDGKWKRFKPCGHCREIFYDHTNNDTGRWCRTRCGEFERKRRSRRRRKKAPG